MSDVRKRKSNRRKIRLKKELGRKIILKSKPLQPVLPGKDETLVVSSKPKTAALHYDRVWCPPSNAILNKVPQEVIFFGGTVEEKDRIKLGFHWGDVSIFNPIIEPGFMTIKETPQKDGSVIREKIAAFASTNGTQKEREREMSEYLSKARSDIIIKSTRDIATSFTEKYKSPVATLFPDVKTQNLSYQEGNKDIIISTIENLQIVDEEELSWEQVIELRNDKDSRMKYKRFTHWLDKDMIGRSQSFVQDEIELRLYDYEKALKKHGVKTVLGTLKEIIANKKSLGDLIAAGTMAIAGIAINLAEKKLAFEECETGANSEISWVHEVKKKTTND